MSKNRNKKIEHYSIYGVTLSYLTEEEKNVINIMQKGEPIAGKEATKNAILFWINLCLKARIISN